MPPSMEHILHQPSSRQQIEHHVLQIPAQAWIGSYLQYPQYLGMIEVQINTNVGKIILSE